MKGKFHGLRHTYAAEKYTSLVNGGMMPLDAHFTVSRLLGHERPDVTDIYLASVKGGSAVENKYRDLNDLPMILRVEDLMPLLGIGRNTAYELIRSGQIRSVRIGRQIRIPKRGPAGVFGWEDNLNDSAAKKKFAG